MMLPKLKIIVEDCISGNPDSISIKQDNDNKCYIMTFGTTTAELSKEEIKKMGEQIINFTQ